MTTSPDTKPWLEDDTTPAHLRHLLASGRADGPSPADLERLAARMAPVVGVAAAALLAPQLPGAIAPLQPVPAALGGQGAVLLGKLGGLSLLKAFGVACVAGASLFGAWQLSSRSPELAQPAPVPLAPPVELAPAPVPVPAAPVPSSTPAPARAAPASEAPVPEASALEHAPARTAPRPTELALIQDAQAQVARPERALAILQRHARLYPDGVFAQEREVLVIGALVSLGRRDQATARAERMASDYPGSAHLRRVRVLLEASPSD